MRHALTVVLLIALVLLLPPRQAGAVMRAFAGPARVVDGDTLRVGGVKVRLAAIDAPEAAQTCEAKGETRACGAAATAALAALVAGREVVCTPNGRRSYDRVVAMCTAGSTDLSQAMVAQGMARVMPRHAAEWPDRAGALYAAEAAARAAGRGLWGTAHAAPADLRAAERARRATARP